MPNDTDKTELSVSMTASHCPYRGAGSCAIMEIRDVEERRGGENIYGEVRKMCYTVYVH